MPGYYKPIIYLFIIFLAIKPIIYLFRIFLAIKRRSVDIAQIAMQGNSPGIHIQCVSINMTI